MTQEEWEEIGKVVEGINLVGDDPVFMPYWEWRVRELEKKHGKEVLLAAMKECHLRLKKREGT